MPNMCDYLRWRGDLTFRERPFNDCDNLVCAALSYLDLTEVVTADAEPVTVGEAASALLELSGGDVTPYVRSFAHVDTGFVEQLVASARFRDARLASYVDEVDDERALQFSAVTIWLTDALAYVAFRGTDDTLAGWRENFFSSYTVSDAQRRATDYLADTLDVARATGATVLAGGHSKGGNLAEFAARTVDESLLPWLDHVWSNDGPGLAVEVIAAEDIRPARAITRIVPSYSLIGTLFAREGEPRRVVKSSASGLAQHDLTTWQVMRDGLVWADRLARDSRVLSQVIARWTDAVPLDERERVVNEVFDALEAGGARRVEEIAASPEGLQQVIAALTATDGRTHELVASLVRRIAGLSVDEMVTATNRAIEGAMRRLVGQRDITVRMPRRRIGDGTQGTDA